MRTAALITFAAICLSGCSFGAGPERTPTLTSAEVVGTAQAGAQLTRRLTLTFSLSRPRPHQPCGLRHSGGTSTPTSARVTAL
jgi:hypothetical protein